MNEQRLREWYERRAPVYAGLAEGCGSVAELELKLAAFGEKWTRWDWAFFLSFLDWSACDECDDSYCSKPSRRARPRPAPSEAAKALLADILDSAGGDSAVGRVFCDKKILLCVVEMAQWRQSSGFASRGALMLLARVFRARPELWRMNWMFARTAQGRVHRLSGALPGLRRPREYYETDAFRQDFVHRWYSGGGKEKYGCRV